jgi:hypothetical protein
MNAVALVLCLVHLLVSGAAQQQQQQLLQQLRLRADEKEGRRERAAVEVDIAGDVHGFPVCGDSPEPPRGEGEEEKVSACAGRIRLVVPHKSASTYHEALILGAIRNIEALDNPAGAPEILHISGGSHDDWATVWNAASSYSISGPYRTGTLQPLMEAGVVTQEDKFLMELRNPMDVIVSSYWSYAVTHQAPPPDDPSADAFWQARWNLQSQSLEDYVLEEVDTILVEMESYTPESLSRCKDQCVVLSYRRFVEDPCRYVAELMDIMGLTNISDIGENIWHQEVEFESNGGTIGPPGHVSTPQGGLWKVLRPTVKEILLEKLKGILDVEEQAASAPPDAALGVLARLHGWEHVYEKFSCT